MRKGLIIFLILSLGINGFLFLNGKSKQKELETAILMNEFVDRKNELIIFKAYISELADKADVLPYLIEELVDLYWILEVPNTSVIPKVTHNIRNPEWELYKNYSNFIIEFDSTYEKIIKSLETKLPVMDKVQLLTLSNHLDTIYNLFMNSLEGWSVYSNAQKFDVQFEPKREQLDEVLKEMELLFGELKSLSD